MPRRWRELSKQIQSARALEQVRIVPRSANPRWETGFRFLNCTAWRDKRLPTGVRCRGRMSRAAQPEVVDLRRKFPFVGDAIAVRVVPRGMEGRVHHDLPDSVAGGVVDRLEVLGDARERLTRTVADELEVIAVDAGLHVAAVGEVDAGGELVNTGHHDDAIACRDARSRAGLLRDYRAELVF